MDAERWFATVSLEGAPVASAEVVGELVRMLDALQPSRMDVARSRIHVTGPKDPEVEILLAHADGEEADVTVAVGGDEAMIGWLSTHEHVYAVDGNAERPWTTVVADAAAAILRGEYELQDYSKHGRVVKTALVDATDGRRVSTTVSLLALLLPGRARPSERRRVDFGCAGRVLPDAAG